MALDEHGDFAGTAQSHYNELFGIPDVPHEKIVVDPFCHEREFIE